MNRIIVAFANDKNRSRISEVLEASGYAPKKICRTGKEAIRAARSLGGGIIICGCRLPDMTADDLSYDISGIASVLAVGQPTMLEMCENESIYKLSVPLRKDKLLSAINFLLESGENKNEQRTDERTEDEKEIIRQAKSILMEKRLMTEPEAHRFIQKKSMDAGFKMVSTARLIIRNYG